MADLRGGSTVGGYIIASYKNFRRFLKNLTNISLSGDVSGSGNFDDDGNLSITTTVANDSHTHDTRYYTESEANGRYVSQTNNSSLNTDSRNTRGVTRLYRRTNSDYSAQVEYESTFLGSKWVIKGYSGDSYHNGCYVEASGNAEKVNGHKVSVATSAPSSPSTNDIWIDTSS